MSIAAIPQYLKRHDPALASPALRFGLLPPVWSRDFAKEKEDQKTWEFICKLNDNELRLMHALSMRQAESLHHMLDDDRMVAFDAISTAPFTTGLGNGHPLENGFAFLSPYGLPYLPGSGVKGVLRQSARELARGDWVATHGWSADRRYDIKVGKEIVQFSMIDALFGLESKDDDKTHVRGALSFWDVIPQIKGDSLMVEIMTPHHSHYYQQKRERKADDSTTPHDSGQPNPISFLTVPPGSGFTFFVVCDATHLERLAPELTETNPDSGKPHWQALITTAFEHAFTWLGFGAKTAVGYGAMQRMSQDEIEQARAQAEADARKCDWVDENIAALSQQHHADTDVILRGKTLAEAWSNIEDQALKQRALTSQGLVG